MNTVPAVAQSVEPLCDAGNADAAETPVPGADPLAGRLGGTRASFEARFGPPADEDPFITYDLHGCEYMSVSYDADYGEEILTRISFNGPNAASQVGAWSFAEAQLITDRLLPLDAVSGEPFRNVSFVEHQPCESAALGERVPAALYTDYDLNAVPGQCSVAYEFDDAGDVIGFTVQMAVEDLP
jgi:hypothetical protein